MSEMTFKLEAFEGPLDLLLHLISKHKLNIYDIEISLLLDQYLEYIDSLDEQDFDAAGDFLAMAARLVYIKTCSLLPQAEEAEEMKKELQGELIEYSVCKEAAANLRRQCVYGDVFVRPPEKLPVNKIFTGSVPAERLLEAYMGMTAKARSMKPVRAEQFSPIVATRIVTVTSKIVYVLKKLYKCGSCTVSELYENVTDKSARVATFLAVLELAKSGRIYLNDDNTEIFFNSSTPRRHDKNASADETEGRFSGSPDPVSEEHTDAGPEQQLSKELIETVNEDIEDIVSDGLPDNEPLTADHEENKEDLTFADPPEDTYPEPVDEPEERAAVMTAAPARRERYALEHRASGHQLTVPVVILDGEADSSQPECSSSVLPGLTTETAADIPPMVSRCEEPVNAENAAVDNEVREAAELTAVAEPEPELSSSMNVKSNRFSQRRRWRRDVMPANCWSFRREML